MDQHFLSAQELTIITMAVVKCMDDKDLEKCTDKIDVVVQNKFIKYGNDFGVEWRSLKPTQKDS